MSLPSAVVEPGGAEEERWTGNRTRGLEEPA